MKAFAKYQLIQRLAAGGMAEVYLATGPNPLGAELMALKLIHAHIASDEGFMAMFLDEARLTASLAHPNLVQIFDLGMAEGRLYLAMEYIRGHAVSTLRQRAELRQYAIGGPRAAAIVRQAALGLHQAHDARGADGRPLQLVHRDISPQNLLVDMEGTVKVVDFGVAKAQGQLATSQKGGLKGKAGYSAPEQLRNEAVDRRADVYALGTVLFELAVGEALFPGKTEPEILQRMLFEPMRDLGQVRGLPPPLAKIIGKAVAADPRDRYASALELAEALGDYAEREGTGKAQLAQMMAELFEPLPRTVEEAKSWVRSMASLPAARVPAGATPTGPEASTSVAAPAPARPRTGTSPRPTSGANPAARSRTSERPQPAVTAPAPIEEEDTTTSGHALPRRPRDLPEGSAEVTGESDALDRAGQRPRLDTDAGETTNTNSTHTETKPTGARRRPLRPGLLWAAVGALAGVVAVTTFAIFRSAPEPDHPVARPLVASRPGSGPGPDGGPSARAPEPEPPAPVEPPETSIAQAIADAGGSESAWQPEPPHASRRTGTLTVLASPWARVRLDGRDLGVTPLHDVVVPAGRHRLELSNPDEHLKRTKTVVIAAHRPTVERVRLDE